ncbi:MAG: sulfite exporter TauE/SafE family protein [Eubacteriales bacterium]|jgi:uncharacterized membrane protein YfcA
MTYWQQLAVGGPLMFLAAFIDSVAGGGGLISLPAYYLIGLPPHLALGCNKCSAAMGTLVATLQYVRGQYIYRPILVVSVLGALVGSYAGAEAAQRISEIYLQYLMLILVPIIAVFTVCKRDFLVAVDRHLSPLKANVLGGLTALLLGFYDGFFGPGTGMFLMIIYVSLMGLPVVTAGGTAKVVNLATTIASLVSFGGSGNIDYSLAIPFGLLSILGGYTGAHLTIRGGLKIIKPVMLVVIFLLMISIGKDVALTLL